MYSDEFFLEHLHLHLLFLGALVGWTDLGALFRRLFGTLAQEVGWRRFFLRSVAVVVFITLFLLLFRLLATRHQSGSGRELFADAIGLILFLFEQIGRERV